MRIFTAAILAGLTASAGFAQDSENAAQDENRWAIVIHGGAGVIERDSMDAETEAAYRAALDAALDRGGDILAGGGAAIDAVEQVIRAMEDDPLFNAGRGAVFTAEGRNELDASIMTGDTLEAGAVAGVTGIRHPITAARAVMENSRHVMLTGEGAEAFAREQDLEFVAPAFYFTERRWRSMERAVGEMGLPLPDRPEGAPEPEDIEEGHLDLLEREHRFGTVGVVALDRSGTIVAGTSTGGTTAKRWGRVGDSPVIGAGTYANALCGVSATGTGEYFIRLNIAARICLEVEMADRGAEDRPYAVQDAADLVIQGALTDLGGDGGVIVLSRGGETAWSFNTPGMYRASWGSGQDRIVAIYGDEE
ncbi:isoaspartyl peptidase/L-asparaginase family protein [Hyphobacterium sp.]|jgi:beta-aspartyl-peptidase (threonine type)|uniref:isoaspartyl peptidase/L-asparaginase family protein n=1 Tax=Hyphobacterium sp. TaxID=2004662 RepID=UPI003BABF2FE